MRMRSGGYLKADAVRDDDAGFEVATAEQRGVGWRCLTAYGVFRRIRIRW